VFWLGFFVGGYVLAVIEFIGILIYALKRGKKK
jgi:hypothetical protein